MLEKTLESPLDCKEIQPVNHEESQSWMFIGRTDAEAEAPILWPPDAKNWLIGKRPWCWERLKARGEEDDRGWDGWMASPTQWTWVWASSRNCWCTGKPDLLQSMGSQRVRHDWGTELSISLFLASAESLAVLPFSSLTLDRYLLSFPFYILNRDVSRTLLFSRTNLSFCWSSSLFCFINFCLCLLLIYSDFLYY